MKNWNIDIKSLINAFNEEKRYQFLAYGDGGRNYKKAQMLYAISLIDIHGLRGTARILEIPRRTLQRWCRKYGKVPSRCPNWVYERAERWRKRKNRYY